MHLTPLLILDFLGIFVFALSGALAAARKQMDVFGYIVLGVLTAVGGGTIRDLVLSRSGFRIAKIHLNPGLKPLISLTPEFWLGKGFRYGS